MKKHNQEINIAWKETWTLQREKQEDDFDLKNKMTKYMANAFFYRLRFRTIDWLTKKIVGGQPLIWWLVFDIVGCLVIDIVGWLLILLVGQNIIANIRIWALCSMKAMGNCLSFPTKKPELIWTSRTQDMNWKPNSVWAAGQVLTSLLLLRFELENGRIKSWTFHESFRSIS